MIRDRSDKAVLEAVDEALLVLGEGVRDAVYYHIQRNYQLRREEIPERLEAFHEVLLSLFGGGANVIEKLIVNKLYNRLDLGFEEHENWTIVDYVNYAKKSTSGAD